MASYNGSQLFTIPRPIRIKDGVNSEIITAQKTLTYKDSQVQMISPHTAGVKTIKLPALKDGAYFYIYNKDTVSTLTVKTPADTTLMTLAANDPVTAAASGSFIWSDGTKWDGVQITCSIFHAA